MAIHKRSSRSTSKTTASPIFKKKKKKSGAQLLFTKYIRTKSGKLINASDYGVKSVSIKKNDKSGTDDTGPRVK